MQQSQKEEKPLTISVFLWVRITGNDRFDPKFGLLSTALLAFNLITACLFEFSKTHAPLWKASGRFVEKFNAYVFGFDI